MSKTVPNLEELNTSELLQILGSSGYGRLRLRRSVPRERLIHLIRYGDMPTEEEISGTKVTRKRLQSWIHGNWMKIGSQIPCVGDRRGQCTIYPCTDGRHIDCYLAAKKCML